MKSLDGKLPRLTSLLAVLLLLSFAAFVGGCGDDGDDGADGLSAYQIAVQNGFQGTEEEWLASLEAKSPSPVESVDPESCVICHNGVVVRAGATHQEAYDELFQHGVVVATNLAYSGAGGNDTVTFQMTKNGAPFDCRQADALNIYFTQYTGTKHMEFTAPDSGTDSSPDGDRLSIKGTLTYDAGTNTCTSVKAQSSLGNLSALTGIIVVYGQDELVESIATAHISLARYPFAAILPLGTVDYVSAANATGCSNCHTTPYYKHGYILADVSLGGGLDFYTCKACHIDNGDGGHEEWQYSVDDPQGWATDAPLTPAQEARYAYTTRLMNDVHMSHFMEFPYPQSPTNCVTCHAGKLAETLSDANFTMETCKSCHPITGGTDLANADGEFAIDTRDMALETIWQNAGVGGIHNENLVCNACHTTGGIAHVFSEIHNGYFSVIYDAAGNRYADGITVSVDSVNLTGNLLNIKFSASGSVGGLNAVDIVPTVMVGLYGYNTKDFLVNAHGRDADRNRLLEFEIDGESTNPRFTVVSAGGGSWEVIADLSMWADMIADGSIRRAEVGVMPALENAAGETVGLDAPSRTFNLNTNAFEDNYYQGTNAIVSVEGTADTKGCNSCHDQLATTFHSGNRGGNIVICRMCHVVISGGSHLQGQSRSIDSYAHAVHSFQFFDVDEVDFSDPVEAKHYEEHTSFLFPDFATINCEACHTQARAVDMGNRLPYDVPDQSKSMPGLLSPQDEIPGFSPITAPEVVVGPGARACGACHRAQFINENDPAGAVAFNQHTKDFGYRVENDDDDTILYAIIKKIMSMFQ